MCISFPAGILHGFLSLGFTFLIPAGLFVHKCGRLKLCAVGTVLASSSYFLIWCATRWNVSSIRNIYALSSAFLLNSMIIFICFYCVLWLSVSTRDTSVYPDEKKHKQNRELRGRNKITARSQWAASFLRSTRDLDASLPRWGFFFAWIPRVCQPYKGPVKHVMWYEIID